jgi:hypothetical protein
MLHHDGLLPQGLTRKSSWCRKSAQLERARPRVRFNASNDELNRVKRMLCFSLAALYRLFSADICLQSTPGKFLPDLKTLTVSLRSQVCKAPRPSHRFASCRCRGHTKVSHARTTVLSTQTVSNHPKTFASLNFRVNQTLFRSVKQQIGT